MPHESLLYKSVLVLLLACLVLTMYTYAMVTLIENITTYIFGIKLAADYIFSSLGGLTCYGLEV